MPDFTAVYGLPPRALVDVAAAPTQYSPLIPGSERLEDLAIASLDDIAVLAPPGTIERGFVLAQALRVLKPEGTLVALAPNDRGGTRLARELTDFGCAAMSVARAHHRMVTALRPENPVELDIAIAAGAPRFEQGLGFWTQPGVFSWNRLDPGTALLIDNLPALAGKGADLGCGLGLLARAVLASDKVTGLDLVDIDRRAIDMARRNVVDPRARFLWADARTARVDNGRDFVVMNPPFHDGGAEDRALGQALIARAGQILRRGGRLWLVANRHLPYEAGLESRFASVSRILDKAGFKLFEAIR